MSIEGKWWLLVDDEPFSAKHGRTYELSVGKVSDGKSGVPLGSYTLTDEGADLLFDERDGERQVIKLRMLYDDQPFDPDGETLRAWMSSQRFERYAAKRVIDPNETDHDRIAREQREDMAFGWFDPWAMFTRDSADIRMQAEANDFQAEEWASRKALSAG